MALNWDLLVGSPVTNVFGQSVTYILAGGPTFTLTGNWTEGATSEDAVGEGVPMTVTDPTLGVQLSAFPAGYSPQQGDQVMLVNPATGVTETFISKDVRTDGQGTAYLKLNFIR